MRVCLQKGKSRYPPKSEVGVEFWRDNPGQQASKEHSVKLDLPVGERFKSDR